MRHSRRCPGATFGVVARRPGNPHYRPGSRFRWSHSPGPPDGLDAQLEVASLRLLFRPDVVARRRPLRKMIGIDRYQSAIDVI
jgi:hypothetical protein